VAVAPAGRLFGNDVTAAFSTALDTLVQKWLLKTSVEAGTHPYHRQISMTLDICTKEAAVPAESESSPPRTRNSTSPAGPEAWIPSSCRWSHDRT